MKCDGLDIPTILEMQMTETKKQQNYLKVRSHIIIATNSCHVNITKNKSTFSLNKGEYYFIEKDSAVTIEIIKIRAIINSELLR